MLPLLDINRYGSRIKSAVNARFAIAAYHLLAHRIANSNYST